MSVTKEMIDHAQKQFNQFDRTPLSIIPTPTRYFEVGDSVCYGGLKECVVAEVLEDGKVYRLDCVSVTNNNYGKKIRTPATRIAWWFDVEPDPRANIEAEELFAPYLPGQPQQSSIDSLFHMMAHNGIVCDPRYQRGYVWNEDDQEALIDSIFNHLNIGSLIFSRHSGYLHKDQSETVTYINFDGEEIIIDREKDYTCAVIDGQQRVTTLWRFFTNQFTYKGKYYKDLNPRDQGNFQGLLVSYRIFDEDSVPYKDVLRMFLRVNRGVPQDESHLEKIKLQLEKED